MTNISSQISKIMENKDVSESIRLLLDLEKERPLDVEVKQLLSMCYKKTNDNSKALQFLLNALEIQPLNHSISYNLGQLHQSFNKQEEAIAYYKNSVDFNSEFKLGMNTLADIFFKEKEFFKAITYYNKSVNLDSTKDNIFAIFRLALCFFETANINKKNEDRKSAIKYFKLAYKINPDEASIQANLIGIYNLYGMKNKAVYQLKKSYGVFDVNTVNKTTEIKF